MDNINKKELEDLVRLRYQHNIVKIVYANALKDDGCDGISHH